MRRKLAEQHRKAAYEALHGQPPPPPPPPPPPSAAAGGGCNCAPADNGRNVTRDETEFNEYKCRSLLLLSSPSEVMEVAAMGIVI